MYSYISHYKLRHVLQGDPNVNMGQCLICLTQSQEYKIAKNMTWSHELKRCLNKQSVIISEHVVCA